MFSAAEVASVMAGGPGGLTALTGITASAAVGQITVNWTAVTGATGYGVLRSRTPPGRTATDSPQGVFDHVSIGRQPPSPPPAPGALDDGVIRLGWKNASGTSQSGVKVEASLDGAAFYEIADLAADASGFENTGIERPAALRYRVRAYNTGGYTAYSDVAPGAPAPQAK